MNWDRFDVRKKALASGETLALRKYWGEKYKDGYTAALCLYTSGDEQDSVITPAVADKSMVWYMREFYENIVDGEDFREVDDFLKSIENKESAVDSSIELAYRISLKDPNRATGFFESFYREKQFTLPK